MTVKAEKQKAEWKSLTPAKRRVAIATDALAQVLAGEYIIGSGSGDYLAGIDDPEIEDAVAKRFSGRVLSGPVTNNDVEFMQKNCQMCARGALFLSKVRKFNSCSLEEVGVWRVWEVAAINVSVDSTTNMLRGAFKEDQLELIETAFERWQRTSDYRELAREFGEDHDDDDDRLIAILQNIIDHNGTFKPEVRYDIVSY